jgi:hypothetical protein
VARRLEQLEGRLWAAADRGWARPCSQRFYYGIAALEPQLLRLKCVIDDH